MTENIGVSAVINIGTTLEVLCDVIALTHCVLYSLEVLSIL